MNHMLLMCDDHIPREFLISGFNDHAIGSRIEFAGIEPGFQEITISIFFDDNTARDIHKPDGGDSGR